MAAPKIINRNNFFVWTAQFNSAVPATIANNDTGQFTIGAASVEIYPLENDVSVFGINANTFEFTLQDNPAKPAVWDKVAKKITYYPPADVLPNTVRVIKYRWSDTSGNVSNEGTVNIAVNDAATAWRGLESSKYCLLDGSANNTGEAGYATLERYYTGSGAAYSPAQTKDNTEGQADYIAPFTDHAACPLPLANMPHVPGIIGVEVTGGPTTGPQVHAYISENMAVEDALSITGNLVAYYPAYKVTAFSVTIAAGDLEGYSVNLWPGEESGDYLFQGTPTLFPTSSKKQNVAEIFDFTIQIIS